MERFAQFSVDGQRLYGMLHLPTGDGPHPAVVLCHGLTGNASEDHFMFTKMARQLSADGIAALRFDCRGSGWSEGRFEEMTVEREVADARAALDELERQPEIDGGRLGLLGLSLGGCVAATVAGRDARVRALVLWAAVAHPEAARTRLLREAGFPDGATPEEPLDIDGLLFGPGFFEGLRTARPLDELASYRGATLVVHGTDDERVPVAEASAYLDALRPGTRQLFALDGGSHTFARADHEQQVIQLSAAWLASMLG
jgi:uncharacterized protein